MSADWVTVEQLLKRGDIELIQDGNHGGNYPSVEEFTSAGVPLITGACLLDGSIDYSKAGFISPERASKLRVGFAKAGDVLLTHKGTMGKTALVPTSQYSVTILNPQITLYRVAEGGKLNHRYLKFFFDSQIFQNYLIQISATSTINTLPIKEQKKLEIPLLPMALQECIVGILGSLDDRITLLRETNATLESIAQALFKSWFVDFDPVRAKAEGRQPEGMDATTSALFPDSFEESELGSVPKGWSLVPFGELLVHTIGGDWGDDSPSDKNEVRVAIIRGTDIPDLQLGTANRVPIRYTSSKKLSTRKLQDGDLVLEVSGGSKDQPTGRALYLTDHLLGQFDCPAEPASFCRLLRPASRDIGVLLGQQLTYIYSIGKTWEYQNQSTGIANFQTAHFLESELVVVPPPEVLAEFSAIVRPMIERAHQSQIRELTQLRDTLLPRLISGQLRLPEAETLLENVL